MALNDQQTGLRVFVTGGTGLIGARLVPELRADGHEVVVLTRDPGRAADLGLNCTFVEGDPSFKGEWTDVLEGCDAVVHLAGENLFERRWSEPFLRKVRDSRVESTRLIAEILAQRPRRDDGSLRVMVSGSAVGYYGNRGAEELTEESEPGDDVLADICKEWEQAAQPAVDAGVRVTKLRTGMVLSAEGGALPKMARPFRWFVGGRVGSGSQYVPWIHIADLTGMLRFLLTCPDACGPFNGTAPNPVSNRQFSKLLAKVLRRPNWLPVPAFALKLLLGVNT